VQAVQRSRDAAHKTAGGLLTKGEGRRWLRYRFWVGVPRGESTKKS